MQVFNKELRILEAAKRLFDEKGFDNASVREIAEHAQIAKGTFYLYFSSKENVLLKIAEREVESLADALQTMINESADTAIEKFQLAYRYMFNWSAEQRGTVLQYLKTLYRIDNTLYRIKTTAHFRLVLSRILAEIIRQGIDEKSFDVSSPNEISEIITGMGLNMQEAIAQDVLISEKELNWVERLTKMSAAFEDSIEKILGLKKHTLSLHSIAFMQE